MLNTNVAALAYEQAQLQPEAAAIITDQQVINYAELKRCVSILAKHFHGQGVLLGQVVGVSMLQHPLHLMTLLALAQVGAVSLPLHPAIPPERRLLAAQRFGATCVVSGRNEFALEGFGLIGFGGVSFEAGITGDEVICPVEADTPLRIDISSGTSGNPKGMLLTHGVTALRNQTTDAGATPLSRIISMDLNFIVGFRSAMAALAKGASMVTHRVTRAYLSSAKLGPLAPARYFIAATLPRTQTGKIRRAELAAMFTLAGI